ncbi:NAD(P)/FAD-dependent oxidoreductase [Nonomuraea sp. NPDC059007]|uniref:NAD(P)/FAD-dependent oxidoreductase n=1 Tax=Nonomuraea sp. NPDC059007 TaxID=3346692 RepID=UPI00367DD34F
MYRSRIVIVGAGFAGFHAARTLARKAGAETEIVLVNPTDYSLYLPLLPEVSAGVLDPRRIAVPLTASLRGVRVVLGTVDHVDVRAGRVRYRDPEDVHRELDYDRLVLAVGGVNKILPIPGVAEHSHGFRGIPEAVYLRDHVIRQIELAAEAESAAERAARCTFVVVGAGYTGTEVAATGQLLTRSLTRRHPRLRDQPVRWLLLDLAPRVLPELSARLSASAGRVLRRRGVEVRTGTSVQEATRDGVLLTDGEFVPTRTIVWGAGVRPDPLASDLGLETVRGRILVDENLAVPGHPEIFACGDAAAVPDLTRDGELCAMTAQHAERQGRAVARNVAASLGYGKPRPYKHHDLGLVVDLGGMQAAAQPLGVPLTGFPAKVVTRGYHLMAMPANRIRTAVDWFLDAVLRRQSVQFGLVRSPAVPLDSADPELPARVPAADWPA